MRHPGGSPRAVERGSRDKRLERERYERYAASLLEEGGPPGEAGRGYGSAGVPPIHRAPYVCYERLVAASAAPGCKVLELGAGTGLHTASLASGGAEVTATDISATSLLVLRRRLRAAGLEVRIAEADMEDLPFAADSFDVVACAGSLSYGEPGRVDAEVRRVLRPGGAFLCVDSLNESPLYRLNRWSRRLRGQRTASTLERMPGLARIASIRAGYRAARVEFFGALGFLAPALASLLGQTAAAGVCDRFDAWFRPRRSAFKFVLAAVGRL